MPLEFAASLLRKFGRYDVLCGKGVYSARSTVVLWTGGFHHESGYVLVFFIDEIYFDFGNLPVPHAERHRRVNKLLQFMDSHVMVHPDALCRKVLSAARLSVTRVLQSLNPQPTR